MLQKGNPLCQEIRALALSTWRIIIVCMGFQAQEDKKDLTAENTEAAEQDISSVLGPALGQRKK